MKTYAAKTEDTLIAFHTGRGGRYHNAGHTSYIGQDEAINAYTNDLFIYFENENDILNKFQNAQIRNAVSGAICTEDFATLAEFGVTVKDLGNQYYYDCDHNTTGLLVNNDGTGSIDIDGDYNTTTVQFLKDLNEDEARLVLSSNNWYSQDVKDYLFDKFDLRAEFEPVTDEQEN